MISVGIYGSDVHFYEHGRIGEVAVDGPLVLGHESGEVIVDVGSDVSKERMGERVAVEPGAPCGRCEQCRRGTYNMCPYIEFLACSLVDGSLTRFVAIDEGFAHAVPDSLSDDAAAMMESMSVTIWATERSARLSGRESW